MLSDVRNTQLHSSHFMSQHQKFFAIAVFALDGEGERLLEQNLTASGGGCCLDGHGVAPRFESGAMVKAVPVCHRAG